MSFPIPGDAIEQSLDLNQHLIHNPAATFFMRVEGDMATDQEVHPGDLLVVDRAQTPQDGSLVVAAIAGQFYILRLEQQRGRLVPPGWDSNPDLEFELWGVVAFIIRRV